jgi:hypothetical protein
LFFYGDIEMKKKIVFGLMGFVSLVAASLANAATISLDPASQTVAQDSVFGVSVLATEFPIIGTTSGTITLNWDPAVMSLNTTLNNAIVDGALNTGFTDILNFTSTSGQLDFTAATNLAANPPVLAGVDTGAFTFLNLSFTALGPVGTALDITLGPNGTFQDAAFADINGILFSGASVTVIPNAVPVPAAVWLFGSGLLGLVGVARRRQVA